MKISTGQDFKNYYDRDVTFAELQDTITSTNWSAGTYKQSERSIKNFIEAHCIGLDVDDGMSLANAIELFKDSKHIIATTKSHQKLKAGKTVDRFRVILFFKAPITDARDFEATWSSLYASYPFLDRAARDCSRFFYPSEHIVSVNTDGKFTDTVKYVEPPITLPVKLATTTQKGSLTKRTMKFLLEGAPQGECHTELYYAVMDHNQNGYSEVDFVEKFQRLVESSAWPYEHRIKPNDWNTIKQGFSRDPKFPANVDPLIRPLTELEMLMKLGSTRQGDNSRVYISSNDIKEDCIAYLNDEDKVKGLPTGIEGLDKLLGGGKRLGELSVLCAEGGTGKNALYHYLMFLWLQKGIPQGYASRELDPGTEVQPDFITMNFSTNVRKDGIKAESRLEKVRDYLSKLQLYFAPGAGYISPSALHEWVRVLKGELGIIYFWIDHLHWCLEDPEDYKAASTLSRVLKNIVRIEKVHIDLIAQPKIIYDGQVPGLNSIKGGSSIGQNIDNLVTMVRLPGRDNTVRLSLVKSRSRLAKRGSITLEYNPNTLRLKELNPIERYDG